ncbi:MAG: hypothetical protein JWM44_4390 [Bacilli bacterium]|jgi:hypothetical protein|nr:hypothetical protein [Bacilli bacterium]
MISLKLQLILLFISLGGLVFLLNQIVKYKLELKYSLLWLFLSVVTIILAVIPELSFRMAEWFGIEKPVNVLFLFGILLSLVIVFSLTIALSHHMIKIKQLSQELAICKNELNRLEAKLEELTDHVHPHDKPSK